MTQPLKYIIESLLFVSEEPIGLQQFKTVLDVAETAVIRDALAELAAEYDQRGGGFELREVAGGYQLRTRADYSEWVKKLLKPSPTRLSRASLETLAIIAYKQPIIRADVEHIRGVDCGGVLRMLLEKKLIRVLGRKDIPGRPMIYGTTRQFLEVFNLKDLRDLPSPKEIEALGLESEEDYAAGEGDDTAAEPARDEEAAEAGDSAETNRPAAPSENVAAENRPGGPEEGPEASAAENVPAATGDIPEQPPADGKKS